VRRSLVIAGCLWLVVAASTHAQPLRSAQTKHGSASDAQRRTIALRLTQEPGFNQFSSPTTGLVADTQLAPNTRIGFHLMTVTRPKLGPEWRTDGRSTRTRKPAISVTFKF
jgi:hypothetical protein